MSCLVFCSTNSTPLFSSTLYRWIVDSYYQQHPLSLSSKRSVRRYCYTTQPWPGDNQHPSFHHRRLGYTPLGLTDRPTDCIRLSPTEYSVDVQPYEASDERPLSQHNSRLTTSISIHTHTTMSTLTRRQSPLDDTGSNPNYDNYDNYGYDPSTCYQEHTCSWWWSSVRSIPSPISLLSARSISLPSQSSLHTTTPNPPLPTKPSLSQKTNTPQNRPAPQSATP